MKITFILTQSLESPSGGGRYFPLAKSLVNLGHQVTILAFHHDYSKDGRNKFQQDGVFVHYVSQMHVHKSASQKQYYRPLAMLWLMAIGTLRLSWAALTTPSDVVHICKTQPMNGIAGWLVHILKRRPVYLDSDDYEAINNRYQAGWQQRIVAWFEDWMPSFADGITVGNSFIANRFSALGYPPQRIVVVHNSVDRERYTNGATGSLEPRLKKLRIDLGLEEAAPLVVYVGSMSLVSHPIDLLLEAFVLVIEQIPESRMILVGGGKDIDNFKKQASALGLNHAVQFIGQVPMNEAPLYYKVADVTVDPRRYSVAAESSFSLKLVESIVCGVPCVTTDIGDRRDVLGDAGLAVKPDDADALAAGVVTILKNPTLRQQMREAALSMRKMLYWDKSVEKFILIYDVENSPDG